MVKDQHYLAGTGSIISSLTETASSVLLANNKLANPYLLTLPDFLVFYRKTPPATGIPEKPRFLPDSAEPKKNVAFLLASNQEDECNLLF